MRRVEEAKKRCKVDVEVSAPVSPCGGTSFCSSKDQGAVLLVYNDTDMIRNLFRVFRPPHLLQNLSLGRGRSSLRLRSPYSPK